MLLVRTELRPSPIEGIGAFLLEPVKKGAVIWRYDSRVDRVYAPDEVQSLPEHVQAYLRTYSTWHEESGLFVLCGDNGRYFNHADEPNTWSTGVSFGEDRAAFDLDAGVELTTDYRAICDAVRLEGADFLRSAAE